MFKSVRENLILKVVSLLASVSLWLYVSADRYPNTAYSKSVNADVARVGAPPSDVIVRIRPEPLPIEVSGPKVEVESVDENEIKAEVDVRGAKAGMTQLKVLRYRKPADAPNIEVKGRQYVSVDVLPRSRRLMPVTPMFNATASPTTRYGTPRIKPEWASVSGAPDDVKRISRLVISVETSGQPVNADLPIRAEDRDNVEVTGVDIVPATVHVEVALEQPPATRTLVVNVAYRGKPAAGYALSEAIVEPTTVTVAGKPEQIQALSNITTQELDIEGMTGEKVMQATLRPPDGISIVGGRPTVRVTFRTLEVAKPPTGGGP
jgi:YbbR domain-containing protein